MLHYHGTPITPQSHLDRMAGKCFCVSYARPDNAAWCLDHGQSVMWDNGAFSAHRRGIVIDWNEYYRWLEPRLGHPHWAVIPDRIDGTEEEQRELVAAWPYRRELGCPVWHLSLPIPYLLELADEWPRLAFGSSGQYWEVGGEAWERRVDLAFNELAKRHRHFPWIHMMRGLGICGDRWPFASADSSNVAQNYKRNRICPERMARTIDAIQSPIRWHAPAEQPELWEVIA